MINNEKFKVVKSNICRLERCKDGILCKFISDDKIFVIDNEKNIAIDISTCLSYPYIKTISMSAFRNPSDLVGLKDGTKIICFVFHVLHLDPKQSKKAEYICKLLSKGFTFQDGSLPEKEDSKANSGYQNQKKIGQLFRKNTKK